MAQQVIQPNLHPPSSSSFHRICSSRPDPNRLHPSPSRHHCSASPSLSPPFSDHPHHHPPPLSSSPPLPSCDSPSVATISPPPPPKSMKMCSATPIAAPLQFHRHNQHPKNAAVPITKAAAAETPPKSNRNSGTPTTSSSSPIPNRLLLPNRTTTAPPQTLPPSISQIIPHSYHIKPPKSPPSQTPTAAAPLQRRSSPEGDDSRKLQRSGRGTREKTKRAADKNERKMGRQQ